MKEFEGTPGPWKSGFIKHLEHPLGEGVRYYVFAKIMDIENRPRNDRFLFNKFLSKRSENELHNEAEANANLIAAAPELLDALQILLWDYKNLISNSEYQPSAIIAREAIKKALNLTTAELADPETDQTVIIEYHGDKTAPVENLLYDMEGFDINEMDKNVALIQSKYIVKRNPEFYTGKADQEAAAV